MALKRMSCKLLQLKEFNFKTKTARFKPYISYFKTKTAYLTKRISHFKLKNLSRYQAQMGVAGLWEEEHLFLQAVQQAHKNKIKNFVAITPYPVHGLEEAMHIPRSWIPWVTFSFGLGGCLFGLWFTWWTSAVDWPVIVGGKPMFSLPAFIPVIFELTILFAALSSIVALFYACGLPHIDPPVIDPALSSHKFGLFVPVKKSQNLENTKSLVKELQPKQVIEAEF